MADPSRIDWGCAFSRHFHQVDATARRIHFFVPQHVGRANRQAKAAVHAFVDDFLRWRMMRVKGAQCDRL
jgi:hypothetical protein